MELKLKFYCGFIIKIIIPFLVVTTILSILLSITIACTPLTINEVLYNFILLLVLDFIFLLTILLLKFCKVPVYVFNTERIKIYEKVKLFEKQKLVEEIAVSDIESMFYHPFRFRYIITILGGELMDGGAWRLHIKLKDGTKIERGCFSKKDAKQLKELYGELIEIR